MFRSSHRQNNTRNTGVSSNIKASTSSLTTVQAIHHPLARISTSQRQQLHLSNHSASKSKPTIAPVQRTRVARLSTQQQDTTTPSNTHRKDALPPVRVRYAPSPTGSLHLGGLRTALYNYLFAKHRGGQVLLRIEDTDRTRLVPGAVEQLLRDMKWIGLSFDEGPDPIGGPHGPYTQSERYDKYIHAANELIEKDHAYHCFCSPDRLESLRENLAKKGQPIIYDRLCASLSKEEVAERKGRGDKFVIRMKMPDGDTIVNDMVRGEVKFQNSLIDDQVLIKSDGFPTYHLANIVDDHDMRISHVIRGEEWLPSTPKHVALYKMFGWDAPQFAHLPLLLREDGGKLSKRFRDSSLDYYIELGFLPESIINFVALLGWHPTAEEMNEHTQEYARTKAESGSNGKGVSSKSSDNSSPKPSIGSLDDISKMDPKALRQLLQDDKTKLKEKTAQLSQSASGHVEVFTIDQLIRYFNMTNLQKSGATVEMGKLRFFHGQHWKKALTDDIHRLAAFASPHAHSFITRWKTNTLTEHDLSILDGAEFSTLVADPTIEDPDHGLNSKSYEDALTSTRVPGSPGALYAPNQALVRALRTTRDHPCTLNEVIPRVMFVFARPNLTSPHAMELKQTVWTAPTEAKPRGTDIVLQDMIKLLQDLPRDIFDNFDHAAVVKAFKQYTKQNKVSLREVYLPLRFALSGSTSGPGVADQICAIGPDEAIQRIKLCLDQHANLD